MTHRDSCTSYEEFVEELEDDFDYDRHIQLVIKIKDDFIGTVYTYQYNPNDSYAFLSIYIIEEYIDKGYGVLAIVLFCKYLFDEFQMFKIYFDVYEQNTSVIKLLSKTASLEGRFKKQHVFGNKRIDVLRYALYKSDISKYS